MATTTGITGAIDPTAGNVVGTESSLSNWVGPYVTDMLGKAGAWSETPYQAYQGPLTAGQSPLQQNAFQGLANLTVPTAMGDAATTAGNVASAAGGMGYNQNSFSSQYGGVGPYTAATMPNQYNAPGSFQSGQFANQYEGVSPFQSSEMSNPYQTPDNLYKANTISTDMWNNNFAQQYMNPYLQQSLDPQLQEARRQAEMTRMDNAGRLAKAGAYGGSRQAIMEAENSRNMSDLMAKITGEGYNRAYDTAGQMFTSDMSRDLTAQTANEQARQAEGTQALDAAGRNAQFSLDAAKFGEDSRQFSHSRNMEDAQSRAKFGLDALRDTESSRQFGYSQDMTAADRAAQYGMDAGRFGEESRQFGFSREMDDAQRRADFGLSADKMNQSENQFGANFGLSSLAQQLAAANAQGALSGREFDSQRNVLRDQMAGGTTQRGIESEGIQADYAQFQQERDDPYNKLVGMQNFLQTLPLEAQQNITQDPSTLAQIISGAGAGAGVEDILREIFGGSGGNNDSQQLQDFLTSIGAA